MAVNSKARTSIPELAADKWGPNHKITKAFAAFSVTGVGLNVNTQTEQAQLVIDNMVDLLVAAKITWGRYGKLRK